MIKQLITIRCHITLLISPFKQNSFCRSISKLISLMVWNWSWNWTIRWNHRESKNNKLVVNSGLWILPISNGPHIYQAASRLSATACTHWLWFTNSFFLQYHLICTTIPHFILYILINIAHWYSNWRKQDVHIFILFYWMTFAHYDFT